MSWRPGQTGATARLSRRWIPARRCSTGCASNWWESFEAVLRRKQRATPAVPRIFDGEKEAKLIALACSKPPKGHARWTLRLFENQLQIMRRLLFQITAADKVAA